MKHGMSKTRLYRIWSGMKERCFNPNNRNYKHYGGRGISVCDEWRFDFMAFYKWSVATGYDETAPRGQFTIERNDYDGHYCPENCSWSTLKDQLNNKRTNRMITIDGETKTLSQWCDELHLDYRKELYCQLKETILQKKREKRRALGALPREAYLQQRADIRNQMLIAIQHHPELSSRKLAELTGYSKSSIHRIRASLERGTKNNG